MEFIKSQRNKPMLLHDGFAYNFDPSDGDINHWRCRGYLLARNTQILDSTVHNHAPNEAVNRKLKFMHDLKQRAVETSEPASVIITRATSNLNEEVLHNVPSYDYLNDTLIRQRNRALFNIPRSEYIDIPDVLKIDMWGNQFIRYDKILIFYTEFKKGI
ncbi:hypothetical protein ENBRE01_2074 [Enteropsectra breve]|nr:hypothetical protein ENBRE01_2074 [Enteropsectra breve]